MSSLKGSQTEKNLLKSFAGESQARNRYTYFAKVAAKEGHILVSKVFLETADQESVHAKSMFKLQEGGALEITAAYPAGVIGTTLANLEAAAEGEKEEHTELYPAFGKTAEDEGFLKIAALYRSIAVAEKTHEERYRGLAERTRNNTLYARDTEVRWQCTKCGYIHCGKEAPTKCPACKHPQGYFRVADVSW